MPRLLVNWIVTTLTILMIPNLFSGVHVDTFGTALAAAAVLGVLNVLIRPILVFLTFPLTLITFGLFLLVINAFLFQFASYFIHGFKVDSFGAAFLASIVVSLISGLMGSSWERRNGKFKIVVHKNSGFSDKRTIDVTPKDPRD